MKKSKLYILALASILTFFGCNKEKESGPAGPAGSDGKSFEDYIKKNGFVKMDVYTKSSSGTDSLILSTEYLHEDDRTDSHYSEGEFPGFSIWRLNPKNFATFSIYSLSPLSEAIENQNIYMTYSLNDTLGNGKLLSFSGSFVNEGEDLQISDYSFDKTTGKIKFSFKTTTEHFHLNRVALIVKGSVEAVLNQEVYLRKGVTIE